MADFMGTGTVQILLEKGILLDLNGNTVWDISDQFDHGQWIAHTPNPDGTGKLVFISELWGTNMKSTLFTGQGKKIKDIGGFPWPDFDPEEKKAHGLEMLPSRCHMVKWRPDAEPEIFLTQQAVINNWDVIQSAEAIRFRLKALFMDLKGNLLGELPFDDAKMRDYFYNGETHSRVADVDGDGQEEIVFPKQDGHVMIIKKRF